MLKNKILLIAIMSFCAFAAKADQLAWITLSQAKAAAAFLQNQSSVIAWCACCESGDKTLIRITNAYYQHADNPNEFYEVYITGTDGDGNEVNTSFDLAYLHYNKNGMAVSVGTGLGFACDPCTPPFKWPHSGGTSSNSVSSTSEDAEGFTYVGNTKDGSEYLVRVEKRGYQSVNAWVKTKKPIKYVKNSKGKTVKIGGGYNLGYISLNCEERKYNIEEMIEYNSKSELVKQYKEGSYDNRIVPGTIMDKIYNYLCTE